MIFNAEALGMNQSYDVYGETSDNVEVNMNVTANYEPAADRLVVNLDWRSFSILNYDVLRLRLPPSPPPPAA